MVLKHEEFLSIFLFKISQYPIDYARWDAVMLSKLRLFREIESNREGVF